MSRKRAHDAARWRSNAKRVTAIHQPGRNLRPSMVTRPPTSRKLLNAFGGRRIRNIADDPKTSPQVERLVAVPRDKGLVLLACSIRTGGNPVRGAGWGQ